jgi:beta-1,4-N-acetylglucosaminyltransferase
VKLLLVCSPGGHLAQISALRGWWGQHDRVWVTFDSPDVRARLSQERVIHGHSPTTRNIPNLVRNERLARRVLREEKPDLVFSTGAGLAIPFFLHARRLGIRTAYLEVVDRIDSPTVTGLTVYPTTDLFLTQWSEQNRFYPGAHTIGPVL